jgi:hypothetical protein
VEFLFDGIKFTSVLMFLSFGMIIFEDVNRQLVFFETERKKKYVFLDFFFSKKFIFSFFFFHIENKVNK